MARRWDELPESIRTPTQLAGVGGVGCGATHSVMERCNFACTSCYLSDLANRTEPLPFAQVRAQLDALRAHLGPGGKAQITSGEVTLLPVEELGRITAYAASIGLEPMVMTNGERLLREPEYLLALCRDHQLTKVSFHVDITQRGRPELRPGMRERDLHPIRDRCAELVRRVRAETGRPLHAAMTVTVTPDNLDDVPDVVEWALENADAVRLVSFLPVASVGRTRDGFAEAMPMQALWERICRPMGRVLNRDAMHFGHPECNLTVPVAIIRSSGSAGAARRHVFEVVRKGSQRDARFFGRALGALAEHVDLTATPGRALLAAAGAALLRPGLVLGALAYGARRGWSERRMLGSLLAAVLRGRRVRIQPQLFVVHRFMDAAELATPLGQERLRACVFKVPVDGQMTSMCEVNATGLRRQLNEQLLRASHIGSSPDHSRERNAQCARGARWQGRLPKGAEVGL